jgi:hypothetical protein
MQSLPWNLAENENSREQNSTPRRPVASTTAGEPAPEKPHSERRPAVAEDVSAAFTWLFGSGCY